MLLQSFLDSALSTNCIVVEDHAIAAYVERELFYRAANGIEFRLNFGGCPDLRSAEGRVALDEWFAWIRNTHRNEKNQCLFIGSGCFQLSRAL
jgi:hypothetical protein